MKLFNSFITKIFLTYQKIIRYFGNKRLKKEILTYYDKNQTADKEINMALKYIKHQGITTFPYSFNSNYNPQNINIYKDRSNGFNYIIRNDKKLYLRRDITNKTARNMYNSLLIEQDTESAHRYLTEDFHITKNDILVDIGCADGFLALDVIEKIKKVYLFEYEEAWIEALKQTFAPWKDKVEIVKRYVSNITDDYNITMDDFFKEKTEKPTFIKIDVEGEEINVLKGAEQIINDSHYLKLAICTYHRISDYKNISDYISNKNINYTTSKNYMLFEGKPYFRRGLIRAIKQS